MANVWDADLDVNLALANRLIRAQFPEFQLECLEQFGEGWDNVAYLANGSIVFRFPRRKFAVPMMEHETRFVPLLANHLPLPIPVPEFVGQASDEFPFPFSGYPLLDGTTACRLSWTEEERAANAHLLGSFLRCLHAIPVVEGAPADLIRRTDLEYRASTLHERLEGLETAEADRVRLSDLVDDLRSTPPYMGPASWVHADLYVRHLLVDDRRCICGVIDWGDMHAGDPALDLSVAFSFLPPDSHSRFKDAYGVIDENTWRRARFKALYYGPILIEFGRSIGDESIARAGEYTLMNVLRG